jgi:hypothetical protein
MDWSENEREQIWSKIMMGFFLGGVPHIIYSRIFFLSQPERKILVFKSV